MPFCFQGWEQGGEERKEGDFKNFLAQGSLITLATFPPGIRILFTLARNYLELNSL